LRDDLMQRFGVGRTPVREAIQQLERDGFVTVIPRRARSSARSTSPRILHVAMKRHPALTPTLEHVVHDQRLLLTAITRGDGPAAEQAAREHVLTFERAIREVI
jgi:DNA-binding GntR family transcriptional regulator